MTWGALLLTLFRKASHSEAIMAQCRGQNDDMEGKLGRWCTKVFREKGEMKRGGLGWLGEVW